MKLAENTKLIWYAESGDKKRTSTIYSFLTKAYDGSYTKVAGEIVLNKNHLVQTTELNQPRLVGGIAPNSRLAASNQNGESRYFTHPEIAYAADEAWSFTVAINWNGSNNDRSGLFEKSVGGIYNYFDLRLSNLNNIYIVNGAGASSNNYTSSNPIIGKNTIITFVCDNSGLIKLYKNGIFLIERQHADSSIVFSDLFYTANATRFFNGKLHYYRIQDGTMPPEDVADEADMISSWLPEVESVVIGSQELTTSNLDVVATVQGNVIANVTGNGAVEKITATADRDFSSNTGWWSMTAGVTIGSGVCNIKSTVGENQYILKTSLTTVGKWYKFNYDIKRNASGNLAIESWADIALESTVGDGKSKIFNAGATTFILKRSGGIVCDVDVDNISLEELNWSNATEIYDAVYAATVGDAAAKEYAALKEAAMWCYYQNDPANGAIYGKIYNKYAIALPSTDIAAYNAANPTAHWGWHLPTRAELTTLAAQGGNACKMTGEDYWTTDNGLNTNGLTLLGSGYRMADGTFADIKAKTGLIAADADFARVVVDGDDTFVEEAITTEGYPARLIKD